MSTTRNAEIAVLFSAEERRLALREEARLGLTSTPKELPPKWFYDNAARSFSRRSRGCPSTT